MAAARICCLVWRAPLASSPNRFASRWPSTVQLAASRSLQTSVCLRKPTSESNKPPKQAKSGSGQPRSNFADIIEVEAPRKTQLTTAERVAEAGKDAGYSMFAIFGLGAAGLAFILLLQNEFGSGQPSSIFRRSLKIVRKDKQVCDLVGSPFKAFGFSSTLSKGWRHHLQTVDYLLGATDDLHRQLKYYIKGKHRKAVVTVDMKETKKNSGKFDFYTISVDVPGMHPILVLDNRYSDISLTSYESDESFSLPPLDKK